MKRSPAPARTTRPALRLAYRIATTGGLGDHVAAPGTFAGSLPAAIVWLLLTLAVTRIADLAWLTAAGVVVATLVGTWASGTEAARRNVEDPGPVVIDEVAGQWLTLLIGLTRFTPARQADVAIFTLAGFLLFRIFDVVKPWPVRRLERLPGGVGIMIDDLAAAVYAGIILALIAGKL
ncbi:MAG: phosphatidylglycerophosphatase A [Acidobacteria bacterium]|nr:phosphatidylglycerophosphatase A [Acidobacteriota bacterium]